jgi:hypothetical protein
MKKKLKLQIEKLRVEQFEAEPSSPVARGTVYGFQTVGPDTCVCGVGPSEPWVYCDEMPMTYTCQ